MSVHAAKVMLANALDPWRVVVVEVGTAVGRDTGDTATRVGSRVGEKVGDADPITGARVGELVGRSVTGGAMYCGGGITCMQVMDDTRFSQ